MKMLILATNDEQYIAKTHDAFHRGLLSIYDTRIYGEGYPSYVPGLTSVPEIARHMFPEAPPDCVLLYSNHARNGEPLSFQYEGVKDLDAVRLTSVSDFWNITDRFRLEFADWLGSNGVDYIISLYPHLSELYKGTLYEGRIIWNPPTFDPRYFNDWQQPKTYDVGLIGSGVDTHDPFYPERQAIHARLSAQHEFSYLTKPHPGWGYHALNHSQVGRGFSHHINSCRMFVGTGGKYNLSLARYFETMASHSLLLGIEPVGAEELQLIDGVNYVKITPDDVIDKIRYYRARPELCEEIAENGYQYAMRFHCGLSRAMDLFNAIRPEVLRTAGIRSRFW